MSANAPSPVPDVRLLFKTEAQERQFSTGKLAPLLVTILSEASTLAREAYGWVFTVTEVWRSWDADRKLKGSGVHPAWRAVDVRTYDIPSAKVDAVVTSVNSRWQYDPLRPWMKVAYHKPHGTGPHIHFQVHPRTRARA